MSDCRRKDKKEMLNPSVLIAEGCIDIADERINIAEGYIGIAKFNSLRINQMLY
ncbi:hypothetical protein [Nostoc sp.]|uniref:hypothetical protein n=1 Tax=Nostoc sp. TaxID=1180 RepID=UPI002FF4CE31